jgi:arylsulfatase A-like enzyme
MVFTNGVASANPFRGRKRSLYDGGIRLPFIVAFPGHGAFHVRVEFIFHFII